MKPSKMKSETEEKSQHAPDFKKTLEIQAQVRQNAEEFKNALNDLYSWEKEVKDKEQTMLRGPVETDSEHLKTLPVRSHMAEHQTKTKLPAEQQSAPVKDTSDKSAKDTTRTNDLSPPTEKVDPNEEKRQQADKIKDRGNKHVKMGEYEQAIHEYTAAIEIYPENAVFYSNRALCYLKLERYNECIEDCEQAIEIDSLAVKAYYRRMQANECLGNNMDALKDCTSVLMIEPKNSEAQRSLDRINERIRKHTKSPHGPNFTPLREELVDILPIDKPPYKRANVPLRRVPIADVVGPKETKNYENSNLQISDEDIDKLFNSNCGPFVEVKKPSKTQMPEATTSKTSNISGKTPIVEPIEVKKTVEPVAAKASVPENKHAPVIDNKTSETDNKNRPLPPPPTSTAQFYSNWKELNAAQKYQYLKSIEISKLCKILGAGFDSDTLTDIVNALRTHYVPNKDASTAATLLEISRNDQVAILSLLMSADERKALTEILNVLKEDSSNTAAAQQIAKNFDLH